MCDPHERGHFIKGDNGRDKNDKQKLRDSLESTGKGLDEFSARKEIEKQHVEKYGKEGCRSLGSVSDAQIIISHGGVPKTKSIILNTVPLSRAAGRMCDSISSSASAK